MKREEKAQFSKDRILNAAIKEFSNNSYDAASLNNICNENDLSKGLIYHYFGNKDDLYLCCVKSCFDKFTGFMAEETYDFSDFQKGMTQYLTRRLCFFSTCPQEGRIFFYTVLQPPAHLLPQIRQLKKEFDAQCLGYYRTGLMHLHLRDNVTEEGALKYFVLFQELFNGYFQKHIDESTDFDTLMQIHETQLSNTLNLMLYGIAKEETK